MGTINPAYKDRVRYELYHNIEGTLIIDEPEGWDSDEKEYTRNKDYHGVIAKFSNNAKYIGNGADFINMIDDLYGVQADLKLTKFEKHPQTDVWVVVYSGYLDLSTKEIQDGKVSVKFNSGGLEQALKSRESENVEIDRLTTIDGKPLPELKTETMLLEGRRIFLKSTWEINDTARYEFMGVRSSDGNTRGMTTGVPFQLVNRSHEEVHSILPGSNASEGQGTAGMMFFAIAERQRNLRVMSDSFKFRPVVNESDWQWAFFKVSITTFYDGSSFIVKDRRVLFDSDANGGMWGVNQRNFEIAFDEMITLESGESASIEFFMKADLKNTSGSERFYLTIDNLGGKFTVEEDSFYEQTKSKFVLAHELAERLVAICTNQKDAVYSEFLGRTDIGYSINGPGALTGNTHGFWVRGFDKLPVPTVGPPEVVNLFKPLTTTFKDFMSSYAAVWNLGMGIETINRRERVRLESLSYFYNFNATIKLPNQIKNVKRSCAADYYYSSLEFGYMQGGEYEEAMGLDEYNAKSTFTTIINRVKNTYTQLSKYRADKYGQEFARRKPETLNNTEDTAYDDHIFINDLKKNPVEDFYRERKWQDDFMEAPSGIFSPETATNLRFSPINMFLRHAWVIASGMIKYPTDYIRYGSSTANSALKTKLIGGLQYSENGNIINSELPRPRFKPEWIEFEHICDFETMRQVEGSSVILGKTVQNFYGLVEFINEKNEIEKGFLFNLKPNGKGQWKLLTANR